MPAQMRRLNGEVHRAPTTKTLEYVQGLIAYKRTHIEREQQRLLELEAMETELLSVVR